MTNGGIVTYGSIEISETANNINEQVRFHCGKNEEHRRICAIKVNELVMCLHQEHKD